MKSKLKKIAKFILKLIVILGLAHLIFIALVRPSNDRNWSKDMAVLSSSVIENNLVTLNNVRNNTYRTTTDFDVHYYTGHYDISKLERVYLITDPFGKLSAHTMLSFEFSDGQRVVSSIEIRREVGEVFENFKGMFRGYELYYVWADENDVVKLRTDYRLDKVYRYELDMSKENVQSLFLKALERTNKLKDRPEFYNLLFNNCTTNIAQMLQEIYKKPIIVDWRYLAPAYAEGLSMKYGLIKGNSIEEVRKTHLIK